MVKSVDKALKIIAIVSQKKEGLGVTELATHLKLNKSSIFKLLQTLVDHGFIEQDQETKKYRLGYKYIELGSILLESIDLRPQANPFLKELVKQTNEVIHLVVYDQGEAYYIEKLEGNEPLRTHSRVGKRVSFHATSVGKVLLANLDEQEGRKVLELNGLPKHTENTITDKEQFLGELQKIRNQGFGVEIEENEVGITCIAAPIFDHSGNITAAVSISGPTIRMTAPRLKEMETILIDCCNKISRRLGYMEG